MNNVQIVGGGKRSNSRIKRMLLDARKIVNKAIAFNADIYHFHDPELLLYANKLKRTGAKVIYDTHEDLAKVIFQRNYIPLFLRNTFSKLLHWFEQKQIKKIDHIVAATPAIATNFKKSTTVQNFPIIDQNSTYKYAANRQIIYHGGITKVRGIKQIVEAVSSVSDVELKLAGNFESKNLKKNCKIQMVGKK